MKERREDARLPARLRHDLRTPLTSIVGCARTLREMWRKMPDAEREELLDIIIAQAARMSDMLSAIPSEGDEVATLRLPASHPDLIA